MPIATLRLCVLTLLLLLTQTGCQTAGAHLLSLIGLSQKPLVIMYPSEKNLSVETAIDLVDPFKPYGKLHAALGREISRNVVGEMCFPFQIEPNLTLGFCSLAVLTPVQYAGLTAKDKCRVLAISLDEQRRTSRAALLVVSAKQSITRIEDLRRRIVAFGPVHDGRSNRAGLLLLREHGLAPGDLSLEVFPVPGALKTFPKGRDVLQSVMNNSSDAGFVDERDWEELPAAATGADELARDRFRVLGKTMAVPDKLVVASPTLESALAERVGDFYLTADEKHADVLPPLHISGFRPAPAGMLESLEALNRAGEPAASQPTSQNAASPNEA